MARLNSAEVKVMVWKTLFLSIIKLAGAVRYKSYSYYEHIADIYPVKSGDILDVLKLIIIPVNGRECHTICGNRMVFPYSIGDSF